MSYHVPKEETLERDGLVRLQRRRLAAMLVSVLATNEFYRRKFYGISFDASLDPLDRLPFTTRAEIQQDQLDHPPYGSNLTDVPQRYNRLHQTSGSTGVPLRWLDTPESWGWCKHCWGVIYRAVGLTPADRLMFPFTFGPFIGWWIAFESALEFGNLSLPAGGMTTAARLRYMLGNEVTFVCCTPTYALRMAEVAAEERIDLAASTVRGLIVAGEPGGNIPATRARIESAWGARVFDHCGMTEIGPWGFECAEGPGGVHVIENEFIAEVINPDTGEPIPEGELGELVLTNLGRLGSPLIRYRTGDQVQLMRKHCACGRWFVRAEGGILGRTDDMLIIRGNNVFPSAVEGIIREFDEVAEFIMEMDEKGTMAELRIVIEPAAGVRSRRAGIGIAGLAKRLTQAIRDRLHFTPEVTLVEPGSLPRSEMKATRLVRRERPA